MPEQTPLLTPHMPDCTRLGPDDVLEFGCAKDLDCFTSCCRDISIILTPYDVLRMKTALKMDSTEFLDKYTVLMCTEKQRLPIVMLKMNAEDKRCPFVSDAGCSLYAHRPWACRMYPLGLAEPKNPSPAEHGFYFLLHEDQCQGHGQGQRCTIREWISKQGIDAFEMMGLSFKQLMLNEFWQKEEPLPPEKLAMYVLACYDLDRFRRFVFETRFLQLFEVHEARQEALRTDEVELLDFAMEWLRFSLFNEKTMRLKKGAGERKRPAQAGPEAVKAAAH
jgi:uncharacterized protein